ncbi:DUF6262 family protein [Streptomyces sp. NPDC058195]|uniref:DUF6262 family protein n=1 Tax=Streptomyces sp. NPDC058195 TaxID=3346375 RepID=UPI0036EDFFA6
MRADNSQHVVDAARQRAAATRSRAVAALRRMDATGQPVSFEAVAREAGVSRSWLYTQSDLRAEISRLRERRDSVRTMPQVPAQQRASHSSLLRRLEAATARNRHLEKENQQLREQIARSYGELRTTKNHVTEAGEH